MAELCQHTIRVLSSLDHIPQPLLDNAAAELAGDTVERVNVFDDANIGQNLCSRTVITLCEQFYRFQTCTELLGVIMAGVFGRILSGMMISAIQKSRRRRKNEGKEKGANMADHRTKFGVPRNLWAESETIHETGLCLLNSAVESLRLMVPIQHGETRESVYGPGRMNKGVYRATRVWQTFWCYDPVSGEESEFAAHMSSIELELLGKVISHNQECGPNKWQFCMFPCRKAEMVSELFGRNVTTIRRVKSSLSAAISNCVIASFGAAAFRFIVLEFGHNSELPKLMREDRSVKFASLAPEMLALEFRDEIESKATPLQRQMVRVAMEEPVEDPEDVFDTLNQQLASPISRATFWRGWTPLVEACRNIAVDGIVDNKRNRESSTVTKKILTRQFRNSVDNGDRFTGLFFGEVTEAVQRVKQPILCPPYCPDGSTWIAYENDQWVFEKSGVFKPAPLCEFADCI
jgi:hypothetical protein